MILKGSQRRGAIDLALHLTNEVDNEKVTVAETRGMVADNLYDGFREWALICDQTRAKEPFYSLSINPDPGQRCWREKEWRHAINHIESRLGLKDQPRAVIFHEKQGEDEQLRKHCHVVWSRIKTDTCEGKFKAVHMGQDYYKLKTCARELAKDFGLELRYGEDKAQSKSYDYAKSHGKNRDQYASQERKEVLTRLWHEAETPEAFYSAAHQAGYIIAQGERRAFVILDQDGQVHALARQLDGIKTRQVRERLGDANAYLTIEQAKEEIRIQQLAGEQTKPARIDLSREQKMLAKLRRMAQRADRLHETRQKSLQKEKMRLTMVHQEERSAFKRRYRATDTKALVRRYQKQPSRLIQKFCDLTGITAINRWLDALEDTKRKQAFLEQKSMVKAKQRNETEQLSRKRARLEKQQRREAQSIRRLARKLAIQADIKTLAKHSSKSQRNSISLRFA